MQYYPLADIHIESLLFLIAKNDDKKDTHTQIKIRFNCEIGRGNEPKIKCKRFVPEGTEGVVPHNYGDNQFIG